MTRDLEGKTALVTGASRGIGRAIAVRLGAAGALVAVNYATNAEAAAEAVAAVESAGGRAFALPARIGEPGAIETLAKGLERELTARTGEAGLDILVNNIGVAERGSPADCTPEVFDRAITNNLSGPFFVTQALLPRLRDDGRVINISTTGVRIAGADFSAYVIAKAGLEMFTRILAKYLGPRRIAVNTVCPGYTRTDQVAATLADPAVAKALTDAVLFGRLGEPEDIADAVYALASPAGRWITGQTVEASGGFRLG
jgi:NAD(P)-dependent dehydrogenase (short-subunit alcohol dehydrogenase family)